MDIDVQFGNPKHGLGPGEGLANGRPAKRSHIGSDEEVAAAAGAAMASSSRAPAFGSEEARTRSYQEEAAVAPELRSRLESIGMRTRFNVNRGYGSPPPSQLMASMNGGVNLGALASRTSADGHSLVTANDVLRNVHRSRNTWARTKSAPLHAFELQPFGGAHVRPSALEEEAALEGDENVAPSPKAETSGVAEGMGEESGIGVGNLKRGHDAFFEDWTNEEEEAGPAIAAGKISGNHFGPRRNIAAPSTFQGARQGPIASATTVPFGSGLGEYLASAQAAASNNSADEPWRQHDFTSFAAVDEF